MTRREEKRMVEEEVIITYCDGCGKDITYVEFKTWHRYANYGESLSEYDFCEACDLLMQAFIKEAIPEIQK